MKLSPEGKEGQRGIGMKNLHENGTRLISSREEKSIQNKENDYEYLCWELIL